MPSNQTVCVTGASGFLALHIVRELLERGHTVRGTVRGLKDGNTYEQLNALPGAGERLELVQADLLDEGSFDTAVSGCEYVIHTASRVAMHVKDPQRELVDPALKGVLNVLGACARAGTVRKVVQTSSEAALFCEPVPGHVYSEKDWNRTSSVNSNPYHYSKTVAERAAWDFVEREKPGFSLVAINPTMIIGPMLDPHVNESTDMIRQALLGKTPAIIRWHIPLVDVRDVAHAHVLAMENDKAHGRYLCDSGPIWFSDWIRILREGGYDRHKLPKLGLEGPFGMALSKVLLLTQPKGIRQLIFPQIGIRKQLDTTKIREELGMTFRPPEETILAAAADLVKWKHVGQERI